MSAHVSDQLVVPSTEASRVGEIREVRDADGTVRYHVRWSDGEETTIDPRPAAPARPAPKPTWEEVRAAREAGTRGWRPTIVAGVAREATLAREAREAREALERKQAEAS